MSKPKSRIGLDIGSYAIKAVEISVAGEKLTLSAFGLKKILNPSKEHIADSVRALAAESNMSAKDVNIAVSGSSVIVRFISMPRMKEEELKGAVRFEAEKFIPFNINDCTVDYQILKKVEKENKYEILLVAAKKDYIEDRIKAVESAGFSVGAVDVDSFALINSFWKNHPAVEADKTIAILNMGATLTNLGIIRGDTICLVRDIAIGGNDFNAAISKGLAIDIAAAEAVKLSPQEKAKDMIASTRSVFANLADEIKLSCSYYENQCGRGVDAFFISGGCAELAGMDEAFEEAVGSKPNAWNPLQFLEAKSPNVDMGSLDKSRNSLAIAIGLALR